MLTLANPLWLFALPIPWLIWWLAQQHTHKQQQSTALYHPQAALLTKLSQQSRSRTLPWLWLCACSLLLLALSRPQWLADDEHQGRNFMLALDISSSMKAQDFIVNGEAVNRLDTVKHVVQNFIAQRHGDRIGLIVFADDAYTLAPLSSDLNLIQSLVEQISQGMAGQKTALGQAIALGVKRLEQQPGKSRNLILLTDGSNTAGDIHPLNALEIAKLHEVKIYSVGVGNPGKVLFQRGPVEKPDFVDVPLDETLLLQLADETDGHYFRADDTEGLQNIISDIERGETVPLTQQQLIPKEGYLVPLFIGLLLLMLAQWQQRREIIA